MDEQVSVFVLCFKFATSLQTRKLIPEQIDPGEQA